MYDLGFAGNRSILMKISHFFFVLDSFSIQIKKKKKRLKSILLGKGHSNITFSLHKTRL